VTTQHREELNVDLDATVTLACEGAVMYLSSIRHIARLSTSGVLHNYPDRKAAVVETGAGWLPFILDALYWTSLNFGARARLPEARDAEPLCQAAGLRLLLLQSGETCRRASRAALVSLAMSL